jgi:hypothetical protein
MNRRDLFRGAGALALSAAMPVPPAPVEEFDWLSMGLDLSSTPDSTAIWVVSWGDGSPPVSWRPVAEADFFAASPIVDDIEWVPALRLPR